MRGSCFIDGQWVVGKGSDFISLNPATGETLWQGHQASSEQVHEAVAAAQTAFRTWSTFSLEQRISVLQRFTTELEKHKDEFADLISQETGKPLWEALTEVNAMLGKTAISIEAYEDRCRLRKQEIPTGNSVVRHKPHGVLSVLGPFNFPGHLPNGHIIPALLAGNTVVFKPSELTPAVAEKTVEYWEQAGLPNGILNVVHGDGAIAQALLAHSGVRGVLFTGSFKTGQKIARVLVDQPDKILALEMGGNNPLVVHNVTELNAAVYHTLQSGYITSGQRCTCARRLIVTEGKQGEAFVAALLEGIKNIQFGLPSSRPEPFMGTVISNQAADGIVFAYDQLVSLGARVLVPLQRVDNQLPLLSPALLDVSKSTRLDEEIFGPVLQLIWAKDFETALREANQTAYGLSAGLLCEDENLYQQFLQETRAGIVNWNKPLTGASSKAPFGGVGQSGNYRPSAYYAADYCAYPVASLEDNRLQLPSNLLPGVRL